MRIAAWTRPLPGEVHNGDGYLIAKLDLDRTFKDLAISVPKTPGPSRILQEMELHEDELALIAVVDGVGHGEEAAAATAKILECIRGYYQLDLVALVQECHQRAILTRGATMGVVLINQLDSQIHYIGVGDVVMNVVSWSKKHPGKKTRARFDQLGDSDMFAKKLINNNGTIGYSISNRLQVIQHEYSPDDMILLYTDGIKQDFQPMQIENLDGLKIETVAKLIVTGFALPHDDATVIVAR